jgi:hypothetical protein
MSDKTWAFTEAKRRALAMCDAYSIYQKGADFIVRQSAAASPKGDWFLVATFQPNGPPDGGFDHVVQTFARTSFE